MKKKIFYYIGVCLSIVLNTIFSSCLIVSASNSSLNTSNSISEIIYQEKLIDGIGIVYSHETFSASWEFCPLNPEYSKELKSIGIVKNPIDVYLADFFESTPAIVDYIDKSGVPISFLLVPKTSIADSVFLYDFELLCGGTNSYSNPEDIFINSQHANFLLKSLNLSCFEDLLGYRVDYSFFSNYCSAGSNMTYTIRGVINEECELYKFYRNYIGDFFIANQYLSLPINSATIFDVSNSREEMTMELENIDRVYNYETILKHFDSSYNLYPFEYRYMVISNTNSEYSYKEIQNVDNTYFNKIQMCYDYYFFKQNVQNLVIYCLLAVFVLCTLFITLNKIIKIQNLIYGKRKYFIYLYSAGVVLSSYFGVLVSKLFNIIFKYNFSINFSGGFILLCLYTTLLLLYIFIRFRRTKNV